MTLAIPRGGAGARSKLELISEAYGTPIGFRVRQYPFHRLPARDIVFGAMIGLAARVMRADFVLTRSITVAFMTTGAGIATALELHQPMDALRPAVVERFERLVQRRSLTSLIVISKRLKAYFESRATRLRGRIISAPLGGDPVEVPLHSEHPGEFSVGYVGQLYPGKGMEIIVPLARACPWAQFHVVGGDPEDVTYWRAKAQGASNLVMHGHVSHARVSEHLARFDVVLGPYLRVVRGQGRYDNNLADWMSPLKIFEYMAHGKPLLCSDLPVLREILDDGETALLCSPDEIGSWVAALRRLRDDPTLRVSLGARAKERMEQSFTRDVWARKIIAGLRRTHGHSGLTSAL